MQNNRYLIALVVALGLIPIVLDTTIVTVALTSIRIDLRADVNTIQWIVTGYILANAAVVTVGGYLSNRFGRKKLFILGIAFFTFGSLLCGIAPGIGWLIVFRILQGIGGGVLLPIGPALAFDAFPQEERARASALVGVPILLAPVFGPILGGYLNDALGWHSIFFINLPVGIIAIAAVLLVLPSDTPVEARGRKFDFVGLALSTIGIIAVLYAFKLVTQTNAQGQLNGWGYWPVWALLATGVVVLGSFALYSLHISSDPALDLRQFERREFLMGSIFSWAAALITYGLLVLVPLYFENVRLPNLSALDTGVALVPLGLGTIVGTIAAAALYRAIGARWVVFIAAVLSAVSAWLLAQTIQPTADANQLITALQTGRAVPAVAGPAAVGWWLFLVGLSFVMVGIAVQTLALEALKGEALSKASSLTLSTKLIFSSIGVAILTTILEDRTRGRATELIAQLQAQALHAGVNLGNLGNAALKTIQAQIPVQAGTWAIQSIFWLIFFSSLALLALAVLLPGRRRNVAAPQAEKERVPAVL